MTETHKPGTGAIFGIVTEEGIAKENSPVYLYDTRRHVGLGENRLLSRRFTREDGGFEFAGLNPNYGDYMVMVTDEDGMEPKNALIQDRVLPIPAHLGSGQLAEWYLRAMRDGAQALMVNWPVYQDASPGEPSPFSPLGRPIQSLTQPVTWPPNPSAPPEIPNMALLRFNSLGWGPIVWGRVAEASTSGASSIETLIDLDSLASAGGEQVIAGIINHSSESSSVYGRLGDSISGSGSQPQHVAKLVIRFSTAKLLTIGVRPNATIGRAGWARDFTQLATADLASFSGHAHVVVAFSPGAHVKVYVNGALFATVSTSDLGQTDSRYGSGITVLGYAQGVSNSAEIQALHANARTTQLSMAAYYNRTLTDDEVADHYKALYSNDLISPVSGYGREVFVDTPHMYWRMDDYTSSRTAVVSAVSRINPISGWGPWTSRLDLTGSHLLVDGFVPSPIAGRVAPGVVRGNGNFFSGHGSHGWPFRDRGSVSCWVRFDLATPAVAEELIRLTRVGSTTDVYFRLQRSTGNRIQAQIWQAGTVTTYTFNDYTPPQNTWVYLAVTIDLTGVENPSNGLLRLYAGTSDTAPTLQQTALIGLASLYNVQSLSATAINVPYVFTMVALTGSMCELAVFPDILTLGRIETHWNARTVV
jgi:hypothetical protein